MPITTQKEMIHMSADSRIQWLHQKILSRSYPNARLVADRFGISHRQAQRDVDYLKNVLNFSSFLEF